VGLEKQGRGQLNDDQRELWRTGEIACVMISCCSGAELQVRRADEIVLRELYPTKSDLYERANDLRAEYERTQSAQS
jgi:hypothetical protein